MAVRWLLIAASFYYLSAERLADQLFKEADSFLARREGQGHSAKESEHQKQSKAPLASHGVQETPVATGTPTDVKVGLPKCSDGILELEGRYEVKEEEVVLVEGPSCRVVGSAELLLWAPVHFQGNTVFAGRLNVRAGDDGKMNGPCIVVEGNLTLQPEARLSLEGCKNRAYESDRKGGCLHVAGDAELLSGHLCLRACDASADEVSYSIFEDNSGGGGVFVGGTLRNRNATIHSEGCHADYGGAIYASSMIVSGGNVTIMESSGQSGGAIYARGHFSMSGGNVTINGSTVYSYGGAMHVINNMSISGGNMLIKKSSAKLLGGAICADSSMGISGGNVVIKETEAWNGNAGAIYAHGHFAMSGGNVNIKGSAAKMSAGAIYAKKRMDISGGNVVIEESESKGLRGNGGAIRADTLVVSGGNVTIKESKTSRGNGGGIYAMGMTLSGGNVTIQQSRAVLGDGGAINTDHLMASGGSLTIKESKARDGGCICTRGRGLGFNQSGGAVSLQGCKARRRGGGIFAAKNITIQETGILTILDSQSDRGGGIFAEWITNKAQQLNVSNCSAQSYGGCFYLEAGAALDAPLLLTHCKARGTGGAIYAQGMLLAQHIRCSHCNAPTSGCLQLDHGERSIGSLTFDSDSRLLPASPVNVAAGAGANMTLGRVDCREAPGCTLAVAKMRLARLLCQRGEKRQSLADSDGAECKECPAGEIRLVAVDEEDADCARCPNLGNLTIHCTSTELHLPAGYMVDFDHAMATDLSAWYRCPNEMACRGGHFNASSVPGERPQELVPMCEEGYRGPGCTSCTEGHARADADILWCVRCADWTTSPKKVAWYVSFFLLKNLALFASAVVSVEGSRGKRAASATLLNQAMSFAAVAGVTMSGAMQTGTFKNDLHNAAQVALQILALPASIAQGQSDAGGGLTMSGQCLLQLLDLDNSIHYVHALMSLSPALLVAGLAVLKGGWLATVVGSNVFLPAFIAGFGKYLVAFRLRPESEEDEALGALHLDFLPPGPQMTSHVPLRIAAVLGAIVGFSALSVCSWIYAVRTRSQEEPRPHVAYLIQAYRPECAIWEVERLLRKVFLALIAAMLPVTLSPALQMEAVTLVLIASLAAHLYFWPYQADAWNRAEVRLLLVSLTLTGLTTCLIANDLHWAKSTLTQRALVFVICSIAGGICIVMLVAFLLAYMEERCEKDNAEKAEET